MPKGIYKRVPGAPRLAARKEPRKITCPQCELVFLCPPSNKKRKYCSLACNRKHYRGINHSQYTGGISTLHGYLFSTVENTRQFVHRRVVEKVLNRLLLRSECVHHIDGNKANNNNSNLLVCSAAYHQWLHHEMGMRYAREHFGAKV
jgi:hypothetical protein